MVAIIETAGKQYCVTPGQKLVVDRVAAEQGAKLDFTDLLSGKPVKAEVVSHTLGRKVVSRKFRNKTRYQRTKGHRQTQSVLVFDAGVVKGEPKAVAAKAKDSE